MSNEHQEDHRQEGQTMADKPKVPRYRCPQCGLTVPSYFLKRDSYGYTCCPRCGLHLPRPHQRAGVASRARR